MRKNTRVSTVLVVAGTLMSLAIGGCTMDIPETPYAFKHNINGDPLVPLTPDKVVTETETAAKQ